MKKWIDISEKDANDRKMKDDQHRQKQKEVQDFLLKQMGEVPNDNGVHSVVMMSKRKGNINVPMTSDEIRINKQLLKEISRKKKEKQYESNAGINSELSVSGSQNFYQ